MQDNFFKEINVSVRLLVLILIVISIIIAKSLYYLIFVSILFAILFLLTNKSVKSYKETILNVRMLLLFSLIAYIIVMRNVIGTVLFTYKILLILLYIKQFSFTIRFEELCNAIKTLLNVVSVKIASVKTV